MIMCGPTVPMDMCYLFGRPYQHDQRQRQFIIGYENTFTFHKDNMKIILGPNQLLRGTRVALHLNTAQFMEEANETGTLYALLGKEVSNGREPPREMTPQLSHKIQEF